MARKQYQVRKGFKVSVNRADGSNISAIGGQYIELDPIEAAENESVLEETPMESNYNVVSGSLLYSNQWFSVGSTLYIPPEHAATLIEMESKTRRTPGFRLEPIAPVSKKTETIAKKGGEPSA